MSTPRTFLTALSLMVAGTACDASEVETSEMSTLRSTPPDEELETMMCPDEHQVAVKAPNQVVCPDAAGWQASPTFAGAAAELRQFCNYEWIGNGAPDVDLLAGTVGVVRTAADCGATLPQAEDAVWTAIGSDVEAAFHWAIGRASASDLVLSSSESSRWNVRVAVVDTVPEPKPVAPRSPHGDLMVRLVNDIACPGDIQGCAVGVVRSLGLPRYGDSHVDPIKGGYYGTQSDLAKGIYAAVENWRTTVGHPSQPERAKLIINMSVGWEGEIFGDTDDPTKRPAVESVHTALEYAACHGALIIAAAGNQGYTCETGPLLPGGWETHAAPDAARCLELGAPMPPGGLGYKPLVYSVGGLDHRRHPMLGSRVDGMPRLAALSTNAVAGGDSTSITGTSAAAAVASGAAALVWSYNPHLSPAAVMATLHQSGTWTPLTADYYLSGATITDVQAINACAALELACNLPGSTCPATPFASPLACIGAPTPVTMPEVFDELALAYDDYEAPAVIGNDLECELECGTPAFAYIADPSVPVECPEPSSMVMPFTLPQPTQIGCPNCTLDLLDNVVYASIDPAYGGIPITDVNISLFDGTATTYFRFGALPLYVGRITKLQLEPALMPGSVISATISITFGGSRPVVDPLLIGP
jgi:hypothetical protein